MSLSPVTICVPWREKAQCVWLCDCCCTGWLDGVWKEILRRTKCVQAQSVLKVISESTGHQVRSGPPSHLSQNHTHTHEGHLRVSLSRHLTDFSDPSRAASVVLDAHSPRILSPKSSSRKIEKLIWVIERLSSLRSGHMLIEWHH